MIKSVMVDGAEALKLMVDGKVAWEKSGLPDGYMRNPIEFNGGQYIAFNFGQKITSFEIEYTARVATKTDTYVHTILGGSEAVTIQAWARNKDFGVYSGNSTTSRISSNSNDFFTAKVTTTGNKKITFLNGEKKGETNFRSVNAFAQLFIGKYYLGEYLFGEVKEIKFNSRDDVYGRSFSINLIACIDPNGTPCMFDTVSRQPFYLNQN